MPWGQVAVAANWLSSLSLDNHFVAPTAILWSKASRADSMTSIRTGFFSNTNLSPAGSAAGSIFDGLLPQNQPRQKIYHQDC